MTYECDSDDQDCYDEINAHQDIIQPSHSTIQIPHRMFNRELFSMKLPIPRPNKDVSKKRLNYSSYRTSLGEAMYTASKAKKKKAKDELSEDEQEKNHVRTSHLNFLSTCIPIRIFIKNSKRFIRIIGSWKKPSDIFHNEIIRSSSRERIEQSPRKLHMACHHTTYVAIFFFVRGRSVEGEKC